MATFVAFSPPGFFAPTDEPPALVDAPKRAAPSRVGFEEAVLVEDDDRREAEVTVRGPVEVGGVDAERGVTTAGVGRVGLVSSLSHESKKSSSVDAAGCGVVWTSVAPSTNIPAGYLFVHNG